MIRGEFGDHGPGTQSLTLGTELAKRGHEVIYASSGGVLVPEISSRFRHYLVPSLAIDRRDPVNVAHAIAVLRKILRRERIDVVHAHNAAVGLLSWIGQRTTRGRRIPIIHHVRGVETRPLWQWRNLIYRAYPARYMVVSEFTRRCLLGYGVASSRIDVTYNGVDLDRFAPTIPREVIRREFGIEDGQLLIGTVAAMNSWKGHDVLIRAAAKLMPTFPSARYLLVGDGPPRAGHEALARDLGVAAVCRFAGFRRDIPAIVRALDVFVLPSKRGEMFPNAILEAMSVGVPWIASRLAGIPELAEGGRVGLLAEPGDPNSLATALAALLADPDRRRALGRAGAERVRERYSIQSVVDRVEAAYLRALAHD